MRFLILSSALFRSVFSRNCLSATNSLLSVWPTKKPTIPYIYHIRFLCRHINKKVKNKAFDSKYLSKLSQVTSCAGAFRRVLPGPAMQYFNRGWAHKVSAHYPRSLYNPWNRVILFSKYKGVQISMEHPAISVRPINRKMVQEFLHTLHAFSKTFEKVKARARNTKYRYSFLTKSIYCAILYL